jgi:hypothetical protein
MHNTPQGNWTTRALPLGQTELHSKATRDILRFDDYYHREFSQGSVKFSIYLAYWKPGQLARGIAGGHTPDTCWTSAGFKSIARRSEASLTGSLPPGEWRRFQTPTGFATEVYFWHIVGGKVLHFDQESPLRWVRDAVTEITVRGAEQYFLRITTEQSFGELRTNPAFVSVIDQFARGLPPLSGSAQ